MAGSPKKLLHRYVALAGIALLVSCQPDAPTESGDRVIRTVFAASGESPTAIDLSSELYGNAELELLEPADSATLSGALLTLAHDTPIHEAVRLAVSRGDSLIEVVALWHVVQPSSAPSWPLTVSENRRHLVDSDNAPVFWTGDAAWGIAVVPTRPEVSLYLEDRARKSVNVALVRVIDHKFTDHDPPWSNVHGDAPFSKKLWGGAFDFTEPNERYWQHVDWVVREAYRYGITILAVPGYLGYQLGDQGWADQMVDNGQKRLREYGQWLGNRYRDYPNLVWVMGGDSSPRHGEMDVRDEVDALARGIRSAGTGHLMTAHSGRGRSALDDYDQSWLDINSSYAGYATIQERVRIDYQRNPVSPTFLIEGFYGNEHGMTDQKIREQMYRAILGGCFGQVYGNAPQWYFSARVADSFADVRGQDWKESLDGFGAAFLPGVAALIDEFSVEDLVPDHEQKVVTSGQSSEGSGYPALMYSANLALAYLPDKAPITIDTSAFDFDLVLRWRSLADAEEVSGGTIRNGDIHTLTPPRSGDWIMILETIQR